jgi:hypothetical protein
MESEQRTGNQPAPDSGVQLESHLQILAVFELAKRDDEISFH